MLLNNLISFYNQSCDIVLQRLQLNFKEWNLADLLLNQLIFLRCESFNKESLLLKRLLALLSHLKTVAALIWLLWVRNPRFHRLCNYFREICAWFHFETLALHLDTLECHSMVSKLCSFLASAHHLANLHISKVITPPVIALILSHSSHYSSREYATALLFLKRENLNTRYVVF